MRNRNNIMKYIRHIRQSGFTLIETIVAIAFLMLAVAGFLTVSTRGIAIGSFAKDEMIATYLAQDAMEYIRAKKDTNILNGLAWLDGFKSSSPNCMNPSGNGMSTGRKCWIDTLNGSIDGCSGSCSSLPPLSFNTATGLYGYGGGVTTKFKRIVEMEEIATDREARVIVTVTFPQGSVTKSTVLQVNMFNIP